jgi:hypothetical protein
MIHLVDPTCLPSIVYLVYEQFLIIVFLCICGYHLLNLLLVCLLFIWSRSITFLLLFHNLLPRQLEGDISKKLSWYNLVKSTPPLALYQGNVTHVYGNPYNVLGY